MAARSRFLLDDPLAGPGEYTLGSQESHHAVNVLRLRLDDALVVFDGVGGYAEAVITAVAKDALRVRVDEVRREKHLPLIITIATAIPKGKRWQLLIEKSTELGVDRIIPMISARSVAKGEGDAGKWRRWMVEAAKQSRRSWLPEICEPVGLSEILAATKRENAFLLLADPQGDSPGTYRGVFRDVLRVTVVIGPEGGFTDEEVEACRQAGAKKMCISPFTLRIETAAATMCAIIREMLL